MSRSAPSTPVAPGPVVRNKALAAGAAGWIEDLPELVAGLERDWRITVGRHYEGGTEAFVARATLGDGTLADGTPEVLKLMIPRPGEHARHEIAVLRLTDGRDRDLGMGRGRTGIDRPAVHLDRPAAGRPRDARRRRPRG